MASKERLEKAAAVITIIGFPVIAVSMLFGFYQLKAASDQLTAIQKVTASQNNIALNAEFFNDPTNIGIINDLYNNTPILVEHGGQYSDAQLDKYLGDFDTISDAYDEGFLSEADLCDSFSYYIAATMQNKEIQKYMTAEAKQDSSFYGGLPELSSDVTNSTDTDCH
ncbi:MAG TPA: hypothetical protein VMA75_00460 [Candidatus Paceibacterota bacterium]|nr:hypothetical protein [Candidatus Paceibacterota bacterium]